MRVIRRGWFKVVAFCPFCGHVERAWTRRAASLKGQMHSAVCRRNRI